MENKHTIYDLKQMQSLPLDTKVRMTMLRINAWIDLYGTDGVYISFSGGKDSTVLFDIIYNKMEIKNIPLVFVNVPTQYPELKQFTKTKPNVTILNSKYSFLQICDNFGFPLISKEVARKINVVKRIPDGATARKFYDETSFMAHTNNKYEFLVNAPFSISDKCCYYMKKKPLIDYENETKRLPITAQLADESLLRRQQWIKYGCNMYDNKRPKSNPMSFWTEQDILQYIRENQIEICSVYGKVVYTKGMKLKCSKCQRTGCMMCGFGCTNKNDERFIQLKGTHPKMYSLLDICKNNNYTFRQAIEWTNEHGNLHIKL